jgi:hypothetical protein
MRERRPLEHVHAEHHGCCHRLTEPLHCASVRLPNGLPDTPAVTIADQPALRGVLILRELRSGRAVCFHGWSAGRGRGVACGAGSSSAGGVGWSALTCCAARAARSASSSLSRQQCLYFFPEPQWHGSLRPGRFVPVSVIVHLSRLLRYHCTVVRTPCPRGSSRQCRG